MKKITLFLSTLIIFAACHTPKKTTQPVADNDGIVNKYWKLVALEGKPIKMAEGQERETHFILRSDSTVTGHTGCNGIGGKYTLSAGNRIRFKDMISTLRYCDEVPYESAFNNVLNTADNYTYRNDSLWLNVGRRAPLAVFVAVYLR